VVSRRNHRQVAVALTRSLSLRSALLAQLADLISCEAVWCPTMQDRGHLDADEQSFIGFGELNIKPSTLHLRHHTTIFAPTIGTLQCLSSVKWHCWLYDADYATYSCHKILGKRNLDTSKHVITVSSASQSVNALPMPLSSSICSKHEPAHLLNLAEMPISQ